MVRETFGLLFWTHLAVILLVFAAWVLFDWRIVIAGAVLYYLQLAVIGGCVLSHAQFDRAQPGQPRTTFFAHYLKRLGITVSERRINLVVDYLVPLIVVISAIVTQELLGLNPLWF